MQINQSIIHLIFLSRLQGYCPPRWTIGISLSIQFRNYGLRFSGNIVRIVSLFRDSHALFPMDWYTSWMGYLRVVGLPVMDNTRTWPPHVAPLALHGDQLLNYTPILNPHVPRVWTVEDSDNSSNLASALLPWTIHQLQWCSLTCSSRR